MSTTTLTQAQTKEVESIFFKMREQEQEKKKEERLIKFEAEALFGKTKAKYFEKIKNKYCSSKYPSREVFQIWNYITKTALELVGEKSAKIAYINGKGDAANGRAERICEAVLMN